MLLIAKKKERFKMLGKKFKIIEYDSMVDPIALDQQLSNLIGHNLIMPDAVAKTLQEDIIDNLEKKDSWMRKGIEISISGIIIHLNPKKLGEICWIDKRRHGLLLEIPNHVKSHAGRKRLKKIIGLLKPTVIRNSLDDRLISDRYFKTCNLAEELKKAKRKDGFEFNINNFINKVKILEEDLSLDSHTLVEFMEPILSQCFISKHVIDFSANRCSFLPNMTVNLDDDWNLYESDYNLIVVPFLKQYGLFHRLREPLLINNAKRYADLAERMLRQKGFIVKRSMINKSKIIIYK